MGRQPRNPRVEILYKSMELLAKCMNALKRLNERIEWLEAIERGETATLNEFRNSLRYPRHWRRQLSA